MEFLKRTWAEIDIDALHHNIKAIRSLLRPETKLMGVVKADAYGHGAIQICRELITENVSWLGVSTIHEAISLRNGGILLPILIFGVTPPEYAATLSVLNITQTIFCTEYAKSLNEAAVQQRVNIEVHVKIDTGMNRLGFSSFSHECVEEIQESIALSNLKMTGIFTHFACSDELSESAVAYTHLQYEQFMSVCNKLAQQGISLGLRHCCNSGGVLNYPEMQLDMVRPGLLQYGLYPSDDGAEKVSLCPVMSLHSSVAMVKEVPKGAYVSYGRTYEAEEAVRLATVPIGYADGYHRNLSNNGKMLVNGKLAQVTGRVCMDQLMIDVSNIPDVKRGSLVTIFGTQDGVSLPVEEFARMANTVNYEVICLIGRRVPRIYYKDGKQTKVVDHILSDRNGN